MAQPPLGSWQQHGDAGVGDAREKRRRQNRESQRRYRDRHRGKASQSVTPIPPPILQRTPSPSFMSLANGSHDKDKDDSPLPNHTSAHMADFGDIDLSLAESQLWETAETQNNQSMCLNIQDIGGPELQSHSCRHIQGGCRGGCRAGYCHCQCPCLEVPNLHRAFMACPFQNRQSSQIPAATRGHLTSFGSGDPILTSSTAGQHPQTYQNWQRWQHHNHCRGADVAQQFCRHRTSNPLSLGELLPSTIPSHETQFSDPLLPVFSLGSMAQEEMNIPAVSCGNIHDSGGSKTARVSGTAESSHLMQADNNNITTWGRGRTLRAQAIIQDFKSLYTFGIDIGVMPEDHSMAAKLSEMESHFRLLSEYATGRDGCTASPMQRSLDTECGQCITSSPPNVSD